jgi:hypothetical protein
VRIQLKNWLKRAWRRMDEVAPEGLFAGGAVALYAVARYFQDAPDNSTAVTVALAILKGIAFGAGATAMVHALWCLLRPELKSTVLKDGKRHRYYWRRYPKRFRVEMLLLDAACDDDGYSSIKGVGRRGPYYGYIFYDLGDYDEDGY